MGIRSTQVTDLERDTRLADAEMRLEDLERRVLGASRSRRESPQLLRLYIEASRGGRRRHTQETVALWTSVVQSFSTTELLLLAREVRDPFPWHPFLLLLDTMYRYGRDVQDAKEHLIRVAKALLDAQGLSKVDVTDIRVNSTAIHRAIAAISGGEELDVQDLRQEQHPPAQGA